MCLMKQDWFTYKLTACINGSENSSVRPAMAHPSPVGCECRLVPFDWESFLPGFLQGLLNHCLLLSAKWAFKCQFVVSSLALCSLGNSEVDEPYAYKISSCILCGFFFNAKCNCCDLPNCFHVHAVRQVYDTGIYKSLSKIKPSLSESMTAAQF